MERDIEKDPTGNHNPFAFQHQLKFKRFFKTERYFGVLVVMDFFYIFLSTMLIAYFWQRQLNVQSNEFKISAILILVSCTAILASFIEIIFSTCILINPEKVCYYALETWASWHCKLDKILIIQMILIVFCLAYPGPNPCLDGYLINRSITMLTVGFGFAFSVVRTLFIYYGEF